MFRRIQSGTGRKYPQTSIPARDQFLFSRQFGKEPKITGPENGGRLSRGNRHACTFAILFNADDGRGVNGRREKKSIVVFFRRTPRAGNDVDERRRALEMWNRNRRERGKFSFNL